MGRFWITQPLLPLSYLGMGGGCVGLQTDTYARIFDIIMITSNLSQVKEKHTKKKNRKI
jgi:hypothetical protein